MALTLEQQQTLNAYIESVPELAAYPHNSDGAWAIAAIINQPATPAFYVWRTDVPIDEIMRNGMNWTLVDGLSPGKARIWEWMGSLGVIDASKANVRAGIVETWKGAGQPLADQVLTIFVHCKRPCVGYAPGPSIVEKLFADTTGGDGTVETPATMTFVGQISYQDVEAARKV